MSDHPALHQDTPLEAASPFELRVNLGKGVPETDVRTALATGDMGFMHSFTTGSAVDGPGVRVVAWTTGCMWRCRYCHNPDTWTLGNGLPVAVTKAAAELAQVPARPEGDEGRVHAERRRTADAAPFRGEAPGRLQGDGHPHGDGDQRLLRRSPERRRTRVAGPRAARHQDVGRASVTRPSPAWTSRRPWRSRSGWPRSTSRSGSASSSCPASPTTRRSCRGSRSSRLDWETCSASKCCRSTSSGKFKWERLGLDYTLSDVQPPSPEAAARACEIFRKAGLTAY